MAINDAKYSRVGSATEFPAGWLAVAVAAAVAIALIGIIFSGGIANLIARWTAEQQYQHGFLIPLVSAYLLWQRRDAIQHAGVAPSWLGWGLVAVAMICALLGELSALFVLAQLPIVLVLWGLILAAGGKEMAKVTFVPILILALAVPLPYFLDAMLTWRFQILSSQLGVWFIRLAGVPVYLEGNVIDLGVYKLQVAEACSGLRYMFPLLSLSFIVAYMFRAPIWQQGRDFPVRHSDHDPDEQLPDRRRGPDGAEFRRRGRGRLHPRLRGLDHLHGLHGDPARRGLGDVTS